MGLVWGTINLEGEKRMFLMDDCEILMIKKWLLRVVSENCNEFDKQNIKHSNIS